MQRLDSGALCAIQALTAGQFPAKECILLTLSRVLGFGVMIGASLSKLPQILAVLKSGSVEGLNPASFELETVGYAVHLTRAMGLGIHWTAYGELFMLLLQAVVLVLLIYGYGGNVGTARRIKVACFCVLAGAYLTGAIPPALIENVYHVSHILFISARVQQMAANYKAKATGQLSLSTNLMNTVGTLVRIFTTIQEGGDKSMLFGFVGGAVLNGIVVAQILTYGKKKTTKSKKIV